MLAALVVFASNARAAQSWTPSRRASNVEDELPRGLHVEHVEGDVQHAGPKDEMIARAHRSRRRFDQLRPGPLRQLMGVCLARHCTHL